MLGWGSELWGIDPWGSGSQRHRLHIPTSIEFPSADVSGTQLSDYLNYYEVEATVAYPWISYDPPTHRLLLNSASLLNASEILVPTSNNWTLEVNVQPVLLPESFADLTTNRVFIGAFNSDGYGGGIVISKQGLAIVNSLSGEAYAIPGSIGLIPEGYDVYTVRIVVSNGTMQVYVTLTSLLPVTGHVLRYTVGALESPLGANDGVLIDLQGSASHSVIIGALAIRFNGDVALIPNRRPIAIPGPDQNVGLNATVKYDGSASFDPEGHSLTYKWALTGTPNDSAFKKSGSGGSIPPATNVFLGGTPDAFSVENAPLLQPGDTLVFESGAVYTVAVGSPAMWEITPESHGKYVRVAGVWSDDRIAIVESLPLNTSGINWSLYHTATYFDDLTAAITTAVPDHVGIFKVQLTVNDGELDSLPVEALVEVTTTIVTFGVVPDVSWIWFHLTDFWNMLEDKDTVEKVWSGFAQGAAEILMTAWQVDYNKSLKDIQRVVRKGWLNYSTILGQDPAAVIDWANYFVESDVIKWMATPGWSLPNIQTFCRFIVVDNDTGGHTTAWSFSDVPYTLPAGLDWKYGRLHFHPTALWEAVRGPYQPGDYTVDRFNERVTHYTIQFDGWYSSNTLVLDNSIVDIPRLQERVDGATGWMSQYTDFSIITDPYLSYTGPNTYSEQSVKYVYLTVPLVVPDVNYSIDSNAPTLPDRLWAEVSYLDNSPVIEANFGSLVGLAAADLTKSEIDLDYLSAVRGLWYAYFRGPSLYTAQIGTQILLGLPFAEEEGTVLSIDLRFSALKGRMLIQDTNSPTIRSYLFPLNPIDPASSVAKNQSTGLTIAEGDTIAQFEPLSTGVDVVDYIKDPKWPLLYSSLFKEIEKFFRFIVRANVDMFDQKNLLFAVKFIRNIRPHYTKLFFTLLKNLDPTQVPGPDLMVTDSHTGTIVRKLTVSTADQRNVGGYRWDDNIAGDPFPLPLVGEEDGKTLQTYDQSPGEQFLFDQPQLFPADRLSVKAGFTQTPTSRKLNDYDSIWAYDDGGGTDIIPLSGPAPTPPPPPYGPLVGVIHYDTTYADGTYTRQWWL